MHLRKIPDEDSSDEDHDSGQQTQVHLNPDLISEITKYMGSLCSLPTCSEDACNSKHQGIQPWSNILC